MKVLLQSPQVEEESTGQLYPSILTTHKMPGVSPQSQTHVRVVSAPLPFAFVFAFISTWLATDFYFVPLLLRKVSQHDQIRHQIDRAALELEVTSKLEAEVQIRKVHRRII